MKKVLMTAASVACFIVLSPVVLAAALAAYLGGVGGGPAGWSAPLSACSGPALEMPAATADTSQVQYQAGTAVCAPTADAPSSERATAAVAYAEAQIGTPYQWGGERVGVGFDCSGLAQAAWRAAGVTIPRVAQDQFDAGPAVPAGEALEPGDLVFFGGGVGAVTHVGIVEDPRGEMIDAPHTGALVRVDPFPIIPGGRWGGEVFVGATRPGGAG